MLKVYYRIAVSQQVHEKRVPSGTRLSDIVDMCCPMVTNKSAIHVFIDDILIPFHVWHKTTPKKPVYVHLVGAGGDINLRSVVSIGVILASAYYAPMVAAKFGIANVGFVQAGLGIAGLFAVNTLMPVKQPKRDYGTSGRRGSQVYKLNRDSNPKGIDHVENIILGTTKVAPYHFAPPYQESNGTENYYRMLLCVGKGTVDVSDIKIDDIPITRYDKVEYEVTNGYSDDEKPKLYTNTVKTQFYNKKVTESFFPFSTDVDTEEIQIDVTFSGLVKYEGNTATTESVEIYSQYRKSGSSDAWVRKDATFSGSSKDSQTFTLRIPDLPKGKYDVEVARNGPESKETTKLDTATVTSIRSIKYISPITDTQIQEYTYIAIRILATAQLSNNIGLITCIAKAMPPKITDSGLTYIGRTKNTHTSNLQNFSSDNPARCYAHLLKIKDIPDRRIDFIALKAWQDYCVGKHTCNGLIDYDSTLRDSLNNVAATGLASFDKKDNKISIVRNNEQTSAKQVVTDINTWGFSAAKSFQSVPDGVKIKWISPSLGYKEEITVVYRQGKDGSNSNEYEEIDFPFCQNHDEAHKQGQIILRSALLQPEVFTFSMDYESLAINRGDRLKFMHRGIKVGTQSDRVHSIEVDSSGNLVSLQLYGQSTLMENDITVGSYVIVWKHIGQIENTTYENSVTVSILSNGNAKLTLTNTAGKTLKPPQSGDVVFLRPTSDQVFDLIVREIKYDKNLNATLSCVEYNSSVYTMDPIPVYDPKISSIIPFDIFPSNVIINRIVSNDEAVLVLMDGGINASIIVYYKMEDPSKPVTDIEMRYRIKGADTWNTVKEKIGNRIHIGLAVKNEIFEISLRAINNSATSDWTSTLEHTVIGKETPPPDVQDLRYYDGFLFWDIPFKPLDLRGYNIRYNYNDSKLWDESVPLNDGGVVTASPFAVKNLFDRDVTILVRAIDTVGNLSVNTAFVDVPFTSKGDLNTVLFKDFAPEWEGNRGLFSVNNGVLIATQKTGSDYDKTEYSTILHIPDRLNGKTLLFDIKGQGDVLLYWGKETGTFYDNGGNGPFYQGGGSSPFYGTVDWNNLAPLRFSAIPGYYLLRMVAKKQATQTKIQNLRLFIDSTTIKEKFVNIAISASGTKLQPQKTFTNYIGLIGTAKSGNVPVIITYDLHIDGSAPTVYAKDINGQAVDAIATIEITGY